MDLLGSDLNLLELEESLFFLDSTSLSFSFNLFSPRLLASSPPTSSPCWTASL